MGKIRVAALGDEQQEKEQKKKADARRAAKAEKKATDKPVTVEEAASVPVDSSEPKEKPRVVKQHAFSKRYKDVAEKVEKMKLYSLTEASKLVKETSTTKFDGTVEIHLNLNPQSMQNKTDFRGSVTLPHGTGKKINVAIADDEVVKKLEDGVIDFDILVTHPSMMPKLAKFARVLGPKGLMPNPKNGTVHPDPEKRAKELSTGEVNFKTEPNNPIIHLGIGKVSFEAKQIVENVTALILAIGKNKIAKATISSTMGPGIKLDINVL